MPADRLILQHRSGCPTSRPLAECRLQELQVLLRLGPRAGCDTVLLLRPGAERLELALRVLALGVL
jgi:hypothetical protein